MTVNEALRQVLQKHPKAKEADVRRMIENIDPDTRKDFMAADIMSGAVRID